MLIIFFTNCQGKFLYDNWLSKIDLFKNNQCRFIQNYNIEYINKTLIQNCDIFIYQPVNDYTIDENDKFGLLPLLKPTCIKIGFPSIHISLWPFYEEGCKYNGAQIVHNYKKNGYSLDKLLHMYDNNEFQFELQSRFDESIAYLKNKEDKYCNCKVSQFILTHYKKTRLFDTQNHPNGIVGSYISCEICKLLNIDFLDIDFFTQQNIYITSIKLLDSSYMNSELGLEYKIDNSNNDHYRNLIASIYAGP